MHRRGSYCDKSLLSIGHPFNSSDHSIGFACKKGLKPVSPNQDSFLILKIEGHVSMYGVFDGHGRQGHDISNFVKNVLPKLIVSDSSFASDVPAAIRAGFNRTQELIQSETDEKRLDATASGTTCTIVVQRGSAIWIASVGDSRAVVAVTEADGSLSVSVESVDHKPDIPSERERINRLGGVVVKPPMDVNHRVYVKGFRFPGLAMSRALGDLIGYHRAGISAEPEIIQHNLSEDAHLILCSDGVWEFIDSDEAAEMVSNHLAGGADYMTTAERLCKESWDRWIKEENGSVVDDITAIVVNLKSEAPPTRSNSRKRSCSPEVYQDLY
jgi:serine/threonine protein phosphatase PrpC